MYTVKWLDDREFDSLPFPEVETSLGIADPKTQTAYVRRTGIPSIDLFNTAHELEHLQDGHDGEHADHFRNGFYYKGFGEIMQAAAPALGFIPGAGPALSIGAGVGGAALASRDKAKAQKKAMSQQQSGQQGMMDQFQGGGQPQQASPAISQVGGGGSSMSSGQGGDIGSRIRQILNQRQSGFYSGRDAGGQF